MRYNTICRVGFARLHVFPYSRREGTRAAALPDLPKAVKEARAKALYSCDSGNEYRRSADSPTIDIIYNDYLIFPNSHKAHEILHTTYKADKTI